jgi:hydroxyacylglutathione hydrolase
MILEQHYLQCLSQASYLIVDERTKVAAVVDPRRDVQLYIDRAKELGARIEHVILTHFHADFLAGHLELREATGATIHLGAQAQASYEHAALADGDAIEFGDVRLSILETPGHTPESISIVVFDLAVSADEPHGVMTGDTLFIGDVGRPDLMASIGMTADELAGMLYDSLREKLLPLADATKVYPGHGAGSSCGKNLSTETVSTMGDQRQFNYALQPMSKEDFVAQLTCNQPKAPAYFPRAAALNKETRGMLDGALEHARAALDRAAFLAARDAGAQVLDTRSNDDFAGGHLPGSLWVGLDGRFASWAGTILDLDRSVLLIGEPGTEAEAALRLARVGIDKVIGYLDGGIAALDAGTLETVPRVSVREAAEELAGASAPVVLDVRGPGEFEDGHIDGAVLLPLPELNARLADVPRAPRMIVHCKSGYRSVCAWSVLTANGIEAVDVAGGFDAWAESGAPVVAPAEAQ